MRTLRRSSVKNQLGFTLLEILIATVIMAFISVFTARMIQQGVKARTKIREELDRSTSLHDALGLMTQDIQKAFSYHDINIEIYNAAQKARQTPAPGTTPAPAPSGPNAPPPGVAQQPTSGVQTDPEKYKLKDEKVITRFIGEKDKLSFTSLNNYRNAHNLQQSDQAEIGYFMDACKAHNKKAVDAQCLWRRLSPYIDDTVTEGGVSSPILEDVKSLKFRYLGHGHEEEWVDSWKTQDGEDVMKGRFPMAVEITVSVNDRRSSPPKEIAMTVVAAPRFINDPPPAPAAGGTGAGGNPPGGVGGVGGGGAVGTGVGAGGAGGG